MAICHCTAGPVVVMLVLVVVLLLVVVKHVLEPLLVLMVVVELAVGRLPRPLSDILVKEGIVGLAVLVPGLQMVMVGVRMELVMVVMLVAVVVMFVAVLVIDLHLTLGGIVWLPELLVEVGMLSLAAFFIIIIALLFVKARLFSSSTLSSTSLW